MQPNSCIKAAVNKANLSALIKGRSKYGHQTGRKLAATAKLTQLAAEARSTKYRPLKM